MSKHADGDNPNDRKSVRYFDMDKQLMHGLTALIVGKRNSGKSILLFKMLSHMHDWFSFGLALSPTQASRQKFAECMPSLFIDRQSPERLESFVKQVNKSYDKDISRGKPTRRTYLVCDDTAFDEKFMRCTTLQEIFLNGRQFGTTCIVAVQYIMKCSPSLRSNADFVFCFWDNNKLNQHKIWEYWFNMMPKQTFLDVFSECTRDYGVLVMDVRASATSRDWHDCVFWYKSTHETEPFTLCDPDFFRLQDYCSINEEDAKRFQSDTKDRVRRLGPDGRAFDVPSFVARDNDDDDVDDDEEEQDIELVDSPDEAASPHQSLHNRKHDRTHTHSHKRLRV